MKKNHPHSEKERIDKDLKDKISSQRSHIDRFKKLERLMEKNDEILKAKIDEIYYDLDIKDDPISTDDKMEVEIGLSEKRIYEQLRQMEVRLFEEGKISAAKIEDNLKRDMTSTLSDMSARLNNAERINIANIDLNIKKAISLSLHDMEKKISYAMTEMKKEIDSRLDKIIKEKMSDKSGWETMNNHLPKRQPAHEIEQKADKKTEDLVQKSGHTWDIKKSGLFVSFGKNKKSLQDNKIDKMESNDSFKNDLYRKLLGEAVSIKRR